MFLLRLFFILAIFISPTLSAREDVPYEEQPGNSINEITLPLTAQSAAELAKIETQGKVLSVDTEKDGDTILFRVKVLHNNGKVKVHRFNRNTGHAVP
jgi:uncharacterized membrane protein YkoI